MTVHPSRRAATLRETFSREASLRRLLFAFALSSLLIACQPVPPTASPGLEPSPRVASPSPSSSATPEPALTATLTPAPLTVRFAVISDYGTAGIAAGQVAALVHSWQPDIILTTGDNNDPLGGADTIDQNIGQYYHDYIHPYTGTYGPGAEINRFFPTLGNHDWYTDGAQPYFEYFALPGNERYYDFTWGPVHFFALNSGDPEPDGVGSRSVQSAWLQERMAASTLPWQVVYFHYSPYSSAGHGSIDWMRWPFTAWGAEVVLSGHNHAYERLLVDGIPYFVLASGGAGIYNFLETPLPESQFRYNADNGAMLVTASETAMLFEFYSRAGDLVDSYTLAKP